MLSKRLLKIIDDSFIGDIISNKKEIMDRTDPDRIYIENIRSFFNTTFSIAKLLCEMAVKEKMFRKKIGVQCPNCGRIIKSFENENNIDKKFLCESCYHLENDKYEFSRDELKIITYYQLIK